MGNLLKKFLNNFEDINEYYNFLVDRTKKMEYVGITNEWLIDNFYLLVEHKTAIFNSKKDILKNKKTIDKMYFCLKDIVSKHGYNISFKLLVKELKKYEKETKKNFLYKDLDVIKDTLIFIYTERLNMLCFEEYNKLIDRENINQIIKNKENSDIKLIDFIREDFDIRKKQHYIFELNTSLRNLGSNSNKLFKELNELLESKQVSLKELINDEYQKKMDNDILISNIFGDLKEFIDFSTEDLYENISKAEKLLLNDKVYDKMTSS